MKSVYESNKQLGDPTGEYESTYEKPFSSTVQCTVYSYSFSVYAFQIPCGCRNYMFNSSWMNYEFYVDCIFPSSTAIEGQLRESMQRLSKLQLEVQKYQSYLNEMDQPQLNNYQSQDYLSCNSQNGIRNSQNRSSGSDESLSRSASDLSQNNQKPSAPGTPLPSHGYGSVFSHCFLCKAKDLK